MSFGVVGRYVLSDAPRGLFELLTLDREAETAPDAMEQQRRLVRPVAGELLNTGLARQPRCRIRRAPDVSEG